MGEISDALKDRRFNKEQEREKLLASEEARKQVEFEAALEDTLVKISALLVENTGINAVQLEVDERYLKDVTKAMFEGQMMDYEVKLNGNMIEFRNKTFGL